ncbi:MAG: VWA domain-containing protein [Ilumatobacteraceae bacterium]
MASRFTYSRWDGTQRGFEVDADALLDELADDLTYHGDINTALRKLMQNGMRDAEDREIPGLRELMKRLREQRQQIQERGDLGGVYQEIADELSDIVDEERHVAGNNFTLDMLPDDLAGRIRELQHYDFQSKEAERRFENLMEKLREQLMQQQLDKMSSAVQNMSPEQMARTKDMMAALNNMLERRRNGEDPQFEQFMEEFGDFFPENPQSLDELLEGMAKRMAMAQAMLNSMTPEQRAQLQQLSDQLLEDMDLRWQMDQLSQNLQGMFPDAGWGKQYDFSGQDPLGFQEAMQSMQDLSDLEQLENLMKSASSPAALAEADMDKVRDLLGDDAAKSLDQLSKLTKMMQDAGLIDQREGRLQLTPRAMRKLGANALRELFGKLRKDMVGQHHVDATGIGHERANDTKPYEFGDPFRLDLHTTLRNALRRNGSGLPISLNPEDFEIERTEHSTRSSTVLLLDLSMSMPMRDNFLPAKKVAMALHHLISSQFPRDYLGVVGFGETARELQPESIPEVSWDFAYGTNMHHAFTLARRMLARQSGTKQIIMITDGEPTAHIMPSGEIYFNYPPVHETVEATLREVTRCTKEQIRINTFMLDADNGLRRFIEQLTKINKGRAFFTTPDTLGDYVLVDFLNHKRTMAGRR